MRLTLDESRIGAVPQIVPMDGRQVRLFLEFQQMAKELGLSLICHRCTAIFGFGKDGVQGDSTSTEFRVICGCTHRVAPITGSPGTHMM